MQNDDFDPFDLSAPPRVINDPKTMMVDFAPKPSVHRVSMGPIFHSRILRTIALILAIVLFALTGYIGMNYRLSKQQTTKDNTTKSTELASGSNPDKEDINSENTENSDNSNSTNSDTNVKQSTSGDGTISNVYCGVTGMPEAVCTTITAVEKDGLKNSPYVNADTSQIPTGTKVVVNEKTWNQSGPEMGNVSFSAKVNNVNYKGVAYLQLISGVWKVVSYTLNQ